MSEADDRIACPACGTRFRASAEAVPEGGAGLKAKCRRCDALFRVLNQRGVLEVELVAEGAPVSAPPEAPSTDSGILLPTESVGGTTGAADLPVGAFEVGDRIGRYEVEGILGRGGMGTVYKAYDPAANRHVALKLLLKDATELDKLRFQREVEVQGNIQHPNIMPILDSGLVGGQRYYVMELLKDPIDLLNLVEQARRGELAKDAHLRSLAKLEGLIERLFLPLCKAVHHANTNEGVLHRDIKPSNILLDRRGLRPLLIDFGVSSILDKSNARLAHLARNITIPLKGDGVRVTGTLVFMPPEQARGEADRRGDVWALGALLHYILSGAPPLEPAVRPTVSARERVNGLKMLVEMAQRDGRLEEAADFRRKIAEIRTGTERTVEDLQQDVLLARYLPRPPGINRELDAIIGRAMARKPEQRYRHAMEMHDDLVAWLRSEPVKARVRTSGAASGLLYRARLMLRRQWRTVALIALLAAIGTWFVLRPKDEGPDRSVLAGERLGEAARLEAAGDLNKAYGVAREAIRLDPDNDAAFNLINRLSRRRAFKEAMERARVLAAEAQRAFVAGRLETGQTISATLREVLSERVAPLRPETLSEDVAAEIATLSHLASGEQPLVVEGIPTGATLTLWPVDGGRVSRTSSRALTAGTMHVTAGDWVLEIQSGPGAIRLPFHARAAGTGVTLTCPFDPAALDGETVYVGAGRVRGPLGEVDVRPLLWDATEVSCARYAAFLASLEPEERARRVPRTAGPLGAPVSPLWEREGDSFKPPVGAIGKPVEGISLHDARAFARFEGKRLPTAGEWAWAATGPDGRVCAPGPVTDLWTDAVFVNQPKRGPGEIRGAPADRSPFGLFDMSGNVAELTSSLATVDGLSGWVVMGSSYRLDPSRAIVTTAETVPGWLPLEGVGFRCVRSAP